VNYWAYQRLIHDPIIYKFQRLKYKGLEFEGLQPGGLDPIGLEFESLVLDLRHGLGGLGLEMFLGFDLGW
jgi:hypothetical protein